MQFHHLDATFGKLAQRELTFSDGLNIIEAPNESGKSTLLAFLRAMLYGLPTRERGAMADKNRYAPWSLAPMRGTLALSCRMGELTLRRDTARANAPMGRFSAVYTGSCEPVAALTAVDCGETLLGVPGEVHERSAFIRQSSLAVDQNAELERRIAALITAGDDGISYTEASAALKKQLNARRYNKSGRIPALEGEITALERAWEELEQLTAQKREAEAALATLENEKAMLTVQLRAHDLCDAQEQRQAREEARESWLRADARAEQFRRLLHESETPSQEALIEARAKRDALRALEAEKSAAAQRREEAQSALDRFLAAPTGSPYILYVALTLLSVAAAITLALLRIPSVSMIGAPLGAVCAVLFGALALRAGKHRRAHRVARLALEESLREATAALAAQEKLCGTAAQELLALLSLCDLVRADASIQEGLARYETLKALAREAQHAQLRCEALGAQDNGTADIPAEPVARPAQSRDTLRTALADCEAGARDAQRTIDYTDGRCRAIGDPLSLEAALAEKHAALAQLQAEYDALALAMDTLTHANTALQNRFSPVLSRRTAELFSRLTGGKYDTVLLDRSFTAQTGESGSSAAHDSLFLSLGALDQLYLAVRLAICETVLPSDDPAPLVLDDALVRFDDARCRAALELLYEESRTRQVLLFTCQHREAAYLAGRVGVSVHTL